MDKLISDEERIRRAEIIAEKRRGFGTESYEEKKGISRMNVFLLQCLVCLVIYGGFYCLKNNNVEGCVHIREALKNDTDFKSVYDKCAQMIKKDGEEPDENTEQNEEKQSDEETPGIGGELSETEPVVNESIDQMAVDVDYVLKKVAMINPLEEGAVTSRFGEREASSIVSGNHRGIDIGAKTGTDIVSASDGIVVQVSSTGDFGKHVEIQADDVVFIYAHCSKILVNEGQNVKAGQKIAEVGSTGKATGPHLHFEVRRENRAINPDLLMNFS